MEYSGTAEEGHRIAHQVALGWLGNERIVDPLWKNMLQNVAEFYCVEAEIHGYTHQFYDNDPAELCRKANNAGCSHILIMKIGLFPQMLLDKFTEWFENHYKGEVFTGHVLDKGDLYYEIHPQCMLVDVRWFCSTLTEFAQRYRGRLTDFVQPQRSAENFHDHYTPKWIKQGEVVRTYEGTCWGWNVVEAGLQTETGVGIWPEKIRETYHYAYGEVAEDYIGKKAEIIGRLQNKEQFFIANTEDFKLPDTIPDPDPDVRRIIFCTSGGLSAPFLSYIHCGKVTTDQKVVIMDRSGIALGLTNYIFENFNPNDTTYKKFMSDYFRNFGWMKKLVQGIHRLDAMSDYVNYHDAFKDYWLTEWEVMPRDFEHIELFNFDSFKRILVRHALKDAGRNKDKQFELYINLSNVFHFYQSAVFFNVQERDKAKTDIENYLREVHSQFPNVNINVIGPGGVFKFNHYLPFSAEGQKIVEEIFPWR